MDCRRVLVLVFALSTACLGCVHTQTLPSTPPDDFSEAGKRADSRQAKRQPRPATCVAYGSFSERAAEDPARSPAEKERFRDQARRAYQQALQVDPKNLEALTALARLYGSMEDHERAVGAYQRAIQSYPREASLYYELGMCHARQKEWQPAEWNLRQAVKLDPEGRQYNHALGFCLARAGQYDASLAVFANLEGEAQAHYDLARMLHHLQQDELCKQQLTLALQKKPELAAAQEMLAALDAPAADSSKPVVPAGLANTP